VVVLGVNPGPDAPEILEVFIDAFQISFPILPDPGNAVLVQYRQPGAATPFPLDYVIDQSGQVAYLATEYDPDAMVATIDQLLATGTPVQDTPTPPPAVAVRAVPNPFNPATEIRFSLPGRDRIALRIHDARGRLVRRLVTGTLPAGDHAVRWRGDDDAGRPVASGTYLAVLSTTAGQRTAKLTLLE